jgi:predicted AlkP superfamily phosphohydrolase/phosphomutase
VADAPRVLGLSLEAAEPTLVRRLIDAGEMPVLAELAERSAWLRVAAEPYIGSETLWPSVLAGIPPEEHSRIYAEWRWDPETMRFATSEFEPLNPLWAGLGERSTGLLDVPWCPPEAPEASFIVRGWATHAVTDSATSTWPPEARELVGHEHPFDGSRQINYWTGDRVQEFSELGTDSLAGLRIRTDAALRLLERYPTEYALINITELHRAGHWLWHTVEPEHSHFHALPDAVRSVPVSLADLYREADRQIGRLIDAAGPDTEVFVFSALGMEPSNGVPAFLPDVLAGTGWAAHPPLRRASLSRRALAGVKAHTPLRLKRAWHNRMPYGLTLRLAELVPEHDWAATRAFVIPSEQHGWIRVNLQGRESAGIVPVGDFDRTIDQLEEMLRALRSPSGEPLVADVKRTGANNLLPDVIVHWAPAAHGNVARFGDQEFSAPPLVAWQTGKHAHEGFCIAPERFGNGRDTLDPTEVQAVMLDALAGARASS